MLNEQPVKLALCLTLSSLSAAKIREIWSDVYRKWETSRVKLITSQNRKHAAENSPKQYNYYKQN